MWSPALALQGPNLGEGVFFVDEAVNAARLLEAPADHNKET